MTTMTAKPHISRRDGRYEITYRVDSRAELKSVATAYPVATSSVLGGSWVRLVDSYPGAWQQNVTVANPRDLLTFPPVYACVTLIAGDIAKLCLELMKETPDGILLESAVPENSPFLIPLESPNAYQTPYQFFEQWVISRLIWGNTYVLKDRDGRMGSGMVRAMHVLDPSNVLPLVSPEGEVFYRLARDDLAGVPIEGMTVPASEIMHDRTAALWHPLVGIPPLYAAALSGTQGINIQNNSTSFFAGMSRPSGILVTPTAISKEQATAIKTQWDAAYGPAGSGGTAVLGDDMKYIPMSVAASDSQLSEQWNLTALGVCMAFHVPPYKLGLQSDLKFNNMQQQDVDYYKQCLQTHIESIEATIDVGLELPSGYETEFDISGLFRMDPLAMAQADAEAVKGMFLAPNEARKNRNLPPTDGGDEPLAQQQIFPLSVLAKRPPPADNPSPTPPAPPPAKANVTELAKRFDGWFDRAA